MRIGIITTFSQQESEDSLKELGAKRRTTKSETDIKMIIKGRSPRLRHVSRTHRLDLDRVFERINLDDSICINDVNTKDHLAALCFQDTVQN